MAPIIYPEIGKSKAKSHAIRIDMTPMVDLGFLLITFFIFTTSLLQPIVTKLVMPKDKGIVDVYATTLLTAILDKGKVYVYEGDLDKAKSTGKISITNYDVKTGLGDFIRKSSGNFRQQDWKTSCSWQSSLLPRLLTQDVLNALDEMQINAVTRYAIIEPSMMERTSLLLPR